MRRIYLLAAILGAILPTLALLPFLLSYGFDLALLIGEFLQSDFAIATAIDVLFASLVFWIFLFHEGRRLGMQNLWVYIPLNLFIGLCFALPLFLYFREGKLEQARSLA